MTREELERQKWNDIFLEDCAVYDKKIAEEYTTLEEQIAKLKEENKELKEVHESDKRSLRLIAEKGADLEKENAELKEENNYLSEQIQELKIELDTPESVVLDRLDEAKELIKNIIRVTWNEGWNYSLDWKVKAEDFLKENK